MKIGDVVLVKITGEPVYITGTQQDGTFIVRRGMQGEDGVRYVEEGFAPGELQTPVEQVKEELDRQLTFYKMRIEADNLKRAYDEKEQAKKRQADAPKQLDLLN